MPRSWQRRIACTSSFSERTAVGLTLIADPHIAGNRVDDAAVGARLDRRDSQEALPADKARRDLGPLPDPRGVVPDRANVLESDAQRASVALARL